jgi:3'-5' exoribonuclease
MATELITNPYVNQIQPGQRIVGFFVVAQATLEAFKSKPSNFLNLTLSDKTGRISAKVWENAPDNITAGMVVKVSADAKEYNGTTELTVNQIRAARDDEYDPSRWLPTTARDVAQMQSTLQSIIGGMTNPHLAALVAHFFTDAAFLAAFNAAPASRAHHAYRGGLLEQTANALVLADSLPAVYGIDSDLLTAALLLAQVGKVQEFRVGQTSIEPTDDGELLGDIALSYEMVAAAIAALPDFPPELARRLKHAVLAQNGRYEWGSPRRPATLEAIALHCLLDMTAHLGHAAQMVGEVGQGETWTRRDKIFGKVYAANANPVQLDLAQTEAAHG